MSEKRRPWDDVDTLTVDYVGRRIQAARQRLPEDLRPLMAALETTILDRKSSIDKVWSLSGVPKANKDDFTEAMGLPFVSFRREIRLDAAKMLIECTSLTVEKISKRVGYRAHATLTNAFTKHFGISPSAYQLLLIEAAAEAGEGALNLHQSAKKLYADGDIDRACGKLDLACRCYEEAGSHLPDEIKTERDQISLSCDIRQALLSEFCPRCRAEVEVESFYLENALTFIPRGWLKDACEDCYRKAWAAIGFARIALINDAPKAWWLVKNTDIERLDGTASLGRYIALISKVEGLASGNQAERLRHADLALSEALALGDPRLVAQARIWRGATLVAMAEFDGSWAEFKEAEEPSQKVPWLSALLSESVGFMYIDKGNYSKALEKIRSARERYSSLDWHKEGRSLIHLMEIAFFMGTYKEATKLNNDARKALDFRRDPLFPMFFLPITLGITLAMLRRFHQAEIELAKCCFDRDTYVGEAATEVFAHACVKMLQGKLHEAVLLLEDVKKRFVKLHRPLEVALAASYSAEAYTRLRNRDRAIDNSVIAVKFFEATGRDISTFEELIRVRSILSDDAVDTASVISAIRRVARRHRGWLPVDDSPTESPPQKASLARQVWRTAQGQP